MNPNEQETTPSFSLPSPNTKQGEQQLPEQFNPLSGETQVTTALERGGLSTPDPALSSQPTIQAQTPAQAPFTATPATGSVATGGMPQIADDTDLIEKEWVDKAKQIVEQTAHDPYLQNKEIIKVKVDYLKKRYNKDVKISDE